jgi:hypothetical protein
MRLVILAVALVALSACVSKDGFLKNEKGEIAHCHASGRGLVQTVMEEDSFDTCMQFYRNHGYVEQ